MKRKTLDLVLTGVGAALTVVLIAAGALLLWGYNFTKNEVHNQLAMQQVYFPPKAAFANAKAGTEITPAMRTTVMPYAGQQVLTGEQAKVYATDFIAVHLSEMPYHGVYSQISTAARAHPTTAQLQALVTTSFRGTTLRAMLLEAYAFSVFGSLALDGALAAFSAAFVLLILTGLGLWHTRRVSPTEEFPKSLSESSSRAA